jgi:hypothetical protein
VVNRLEGDAVFVQLAIPLWVPGAARLIRQKRLDDQPLEVRNLVSSLAHGNLLVQEVESSFARNVNPVYEFVTR